MTKYNIEYKELIDEINLVEMALEEIEKRQTVDNNLQERERIERRILDYENHLRSLARKIEFYENKVG